MYNFAFRYKRRAIFCIMCEQDPKECTSLTITADDVIDNATHTTIYYTAVTNGVGIWGESLSKTITGTAISNYTKVTYSGIDGGSHRITVTYKKDGSQHSGTDRGYLIIPKYQ